MDDLTVERVLAVHERILAVDGGDARLLSEPNLHQLVFRANLVPDVFRRAALVLFTLTAYPAFREGNKRTAAVLAAGILGQEQHRLEPGDARLWELLAGVTAFTTEPEDIEAWLRANVPREKAAPG
ncbi:MAG: Fic family protein [Methanoregulaceae archaeon]